MKSNNVTLLVNSCDSYSDIQDIFFELLHKFWPDLSFDIVLSTESLDYKNKYYKIKNVHPKDCKCSWTRRLYEALDSIESDYVLFMLDDFFLFDYVKNDEILKCVNFLKEDSSIANFTYWPRLVGWKQTSKEGYLLRKKGAKYKVAAISCLWNRKQFMKYVKDIDENIWEFEVNGTIRSNTLYPNDKFYCLDNNNIVIPYDFSKYGLISGKWFKDTVKLFKELRIKVDFEKRGIFDEALYGLNQSFISSFRIEPFIIPNYSYKKFNPEIYHKKIFPKGKFELDFDIRGAKDIIRLILSEQRGFGVNNFIVQVTYKDGNKQIINSDDLFGSFIKIDKTLIFNSGAANICIPLQKNKKVIHISACGESVCPLSEEYLKQAYQKCTESKVEYYNQLSKLIDFDRNVNFLNINQIKIKPKLGMKKYKHSIIICNNHKYEFEINNPEIHIEKLFLSDNIYYALKDLKVKNEKNIICNISGLPMKIDNHYLFLSNNNIEVEVPANSRKIIIGFKLVKPIDKKILAKTVGLSVR